MVETHPPGRVLVAPDSFKGTYAAREVAQAVAAGIRAAGWSTDELPLADGGEGTLEVLAPHLGLKRITTSTCNPWGAMMTATYGLNSRTAVIELAAASGYSTPHGGTRDPVSADTRGTGMLIVDAIRRGAKQVLIAAGGSITTDGGSGAAQAIWESGGLRGAELTVLTDVETRFIDAAALFAPQKGASAEQVKQLEQRLSAAAVAMPRDPRSVSGGGAAGGLAGGMWGWFGAAIAPGADYVLDAVGLEERLQGCCAVVVGEGRLDGQTAAGKLVQAVIRRKGVVPAYAVVGSVGEGADRVTGLEKILIARDLAEMRDAGMRIIQGLRPARDG